MTIDLSSLYKATTQLQTSLQCRNITSHTYNEDKAEQIFLKLDSFLEEATFLLNELQNRAKKSDP